MHCVAFVCDIMVLFVCRVDVVVLLTCFVMCAFTRCCCCALLLCILIWCACIILCARVIYVSLFWGLVVFLCCVPLAFVFFVCVGIRMLFCVGVCDCLRYLFWILLLRVCSLLV